MNKKLLISLISFVMLLAIAIPSGGQVFANQKTNNHYRNNPMDTPSSIQEMNTEEKQLFNELVQEQIDLNTFNSEKEKEIIKEAIVNLYDENSETYNNLEYAQEELAQKLNETSNARLGIITTNLAGMAINVAIGLAVGGGVGAITAYIKKVGKENAKKLFAKTVTSKLKAWGANKLANVVTVAVAFALEAADIGQKIAKEIDKRDKKPNNGWIDI